MAKKRKTRSSASTTQPDTEPLQPTPEPEQTEPPTISEPEETYQTSETEPPTELEPDQNQETIEAEETIVSEPEQNQEEAIVAQTEENQETIPAQDLDQPNEEENDISEKLEKPEKLEKEEEGLEEESVETLLEPFTKDQLTLLLKESISKHPDLIENVNKLADFDPSQRKIFVHGLGWDSTVETITPIFEEFGEIEDCRVVKDKVSGKSKGYAFILFKKRKGAQNALKEPQKTIGGRMTSSQLASAGPVTNNVAVGVFGNEQSVSESTLRKIFVSNVGAETDTSKLVEFFAKFGEIEEGPLGLDKLTGKPRGFCLFVYKSVESAKKALVEPHKSFEGQMLHCQQAVDGPRNGNGKGSGFPQRQQGGYRHTTKRGRYNGGGGHMMAPSARPVYNNNLVVAPEAIGQAFAALLAQSGGGGYGNMMNNAGYGVQPGYQGGYGGQQQTGQGGVWPHQGGAPYMGHGR